MLVAQLITYDYNKHMTELDLTIRTPHAIVDCVTFHPTGEVQFQFTVCVQINVLKQYTTISLTSTDCSTVIAIPNSSLT
jgi:hypothetical protein